MFNLTGDKNLNTENELGYNIYLHEKGQLWQSTRMIQGQSKPIFLPAGRELEGSFSMTEKTSINKDSEPCNNDPSYSFSSCITRHIARLTGCTLDWFNSSIGTEFLPCTTKDHLLAFNENQIRFLTASWRELSTESGCYAKCTVNQFHFTKTKEEVANWKRDWTSAFYLTAEDTSVKKEEEFWVFDLSDSINGIGGAMGLFLGWSLLFLFQKCASTARNLFRNSFAS